MRREHTGNAKTTTLNGGISAGDTSFTVVDGTGYPTGSVGPFVVTIGADTASEEKILVTSRSGNVFNVSSRGYDGSSAASHDNSSSVQHTFSAVEADEANAHVNDTSLDQHTQYVKKSTLVSKGDLYAASGSATPARVPVGTDGYVLVASSAAAAGVAWAPAGISQTAADARYLKLSNGGTFQQVDDVVQLYGGVITKPVDASNTSLVVASRPSQISDPFTVADSALSGLFGIMPTGRMRFQQQVAKGNLVTNIGAAGSASAMVTPAKYLLVEADGATYRIALFN